MQPFLLQPLLLVSFLAVLVVSANKAVEAISRFSRTVGISELSSGLVIVAISTSIPESTVAVFSATTGNMGITLGDIFGSNVTDITLVAALLLVLSPVKRIEDKRTVVTLSRELLLASLIPIVLLVLKVSHWAMGLALLAAFSYFIVHTLKNGRERRGETRLSGSPSRQLLIFLIMITVVIVSARIVVESASSIAAATGLKESIIGASIVALGTSLPELSVDTIAAKKGLLGLALGDIIGSCVVNITLVLGIALSLSPVTTNFRILTELISFAIAAPFVMFLFIRNGRVSRRHGLVLLAMYVLFLAVIYGTQFTLPR